MSSLGRCACARLLYCEASDETENPRFALCSPPPDIVKYLAHLGALAKHRRETPDIMLNFCCLAFESDRQRMFDD